MFASLDKLAPEFLFNRGCLTGVDNMARMWAQNTETVCVTVVGGSSDNLFGLCPDPLTVLVFPEGDSKVTAILAAAKKLGIKIVEKK